MVLRKSSTSEGTYSYPNSPTSSMAAPDGSSFPNTHQSLYSSNLPQSPAFNLQPVDETRKMAPTEQNPWADIPDLSGGANKSLPAPGTASSASRNFETSQTSKDLPELPKWGENHMDTPRSSSDESQGSRGFWEEDDEAEQEQAGKSKQEAGQNLIPQASPSDQKVIRDSPALGPNNLQIPLVKRKPVGDSAASPHPLSARSPSYDFGSNNPFRQQVTGSPMAQNEFGSRNFSLPIESYSDPNLAGGKGKEVLRSPISAETPIQMKATLSPSDRPFSEFSSSFRPSDINLGRSQGKNVPVTIPPLPSAAPPPVPTNVFGPIDQPPLIPVTPDLLSSDNPWASVDQFSASQGNLSNTHTGTSQTIPYIPASVSKQEIGIIASGGPSPPSLDSNPSFTRGSTNLLDEDLAPPLPRRQAEKTFDHPRDNEQPTEVPPPKPPRARVNATTLTEAALVKLKEQRNETYQIKHFNWFDHNTGMLRRSSMLTQNKNGPCPLLALVNALTLAKPDDNESALSNALGMRERVSLGLIIESLMDELTSDGRADSLEELPDVDELNGFLVKLHTGMNANPRFVAPPKPTPNLMDARNSVLHLPQSFNDDRKPGTFEQTRDLILYGAFSVPLVHGWLPHRSDSAAAAFNRAAPTYEDAQTILFGEEELEGKLSEGGLTPQEQQLWEDIVSIRTFLRAYPTQLTPYGLNVVSDSLYPGAFAIMFRNDHFSTVYKHPESGQLFTLVTDAGYADKDEVIWETLADVSGKQSEFFSGDFRPVGNAEEPISTSHDQRVPVGGRSGLRLHSELSNTSTGETPLSPQEMQSQHDADFAMALQLQEEEEARAGGVPPRSRASTSDRHSNIPIRLRPQPDAGPAIPPRNPRPQTTNRPANITDEAPPPAYEEAAKGLPYIPPPGHPQHAGSDPSPRSSTTAISPVVSAPGLMAAPRPSRAQQQQRRMSAFQENSEQFYRDRHQMMRQTSGLGVGQGSGRPKERDKECIVM